MYIKSIYTRSNVNTHELIGKIVVLIGSNDRGVFDYSHLLCGVLMILTNHKKKVSQSIRCCSIKNEHKKKFKKK